MLVWFCFARFCGNWFFRKKSRSSAKSRANPRNELTHRFQEARISAGRSAVLFAIFREKFSEKANQFNKSGHALGRREPACSPMSFRENFQWCFRWLALSFVFSFDCCAVCTADFGNLVGWLFAKSDILNIIVSLALVGWKHYPKRTPKIGPARTHGCGTGQVFSVMPISILAKHQRVNYQRTLPLNRVFNKCVHELRQEPLKDNTIQKLKFWGRLYFHFTVFHWLATEFWVKLSEIWISTSQLMFGTWEVCVKFAWRTAKTRLTTPEGWRSDFTQFSKIRTQITHSLISLTHHVKQWTY